MPSNDRLIMVLMRVAVTLIFLFMFLLSAIDKWIEFVRERGAPEWFVNQFGETVLGRLPMGPQFVGITIFETVLAVGAIVSLFSLEWLRTRAPILKLTLVGVLFLFIALGFGARVSSQYDDAAFHFMYFVGTLLALVVIDRDERVATRAKVSN